jgi:hypothetical protein
MLLPIKHKVSVNGFHRTLSTKILLTWLHVFPTSMASSLTVLFLLHLKGAIKSPPPVFFKISRQCPLVLLAELSLGKGKALGSERVKFLDVRFNVKRGNKLSRGFSMYDRN